MGFFFAGDLTTGKILVRNIPALSGTTVVTLNDAGSISCKVQLPLVDPNTGVVIPIDSLISGGKSFLGYDEGGKILNCGPIWVDNYDVDKQQLEYKAAGIRSYYDYRFVIPLLVDSTSTDVPVGHDTVFTPGSGLSLNTIAKRIVQQAHSWTNGHVPMLFEADIAGTAQRTYLGADLHVVSNILGDITGVIGGPDIAFPATYVSGAPNYITWNMKTGNPEIKQSGPDLVWDTGTINPSISGATLTTDWTYLATDDYETGDPVTVAGDTGAGDVLMTKSVDSTLPLLGYPRMETTEAHSGLSIRQTAQDYGDQAVLAGRFPMKTWKFNAKVDQYPKITDIDEGDYAQIHTQNDPKLGTSNNPCRILSYSIALGDVTAKITCAPVRVATALPPAAITLRVTDLVAHT